MLDPKLLRTQLDKIAEKLHTRNFKINIDAIQVLEEKRKKHQKNLQDLQALRNSLSKEIGKCKAKELDCQELFNDVSNLKEKLEKAKQLEEEVKLEIEHIYASIPNLPHSSVPVGNTEEDNIEVRAVGTPREFNFKIKDHIDLAEYRGWYDNEAAVKITSSRFAVLKGSLPKLQRALIQFMLDVHTEEHSYEEFYVPYLVNKHSLRGTGQLPKFEADLYKIVKHEEHENEEHDLYLIPTAEVPVTNLVADKILDESELPLKMTTHTPCFRSEAGSYGRDTKGLIRQHQFEKVEIVQIVHPKNSYETLEQITKHAEIILQKLELPYRVMSLCTGDIGFSSTKTYDLEVWLPGQNNYREISSCSNFEDFQARRLKSRFRDKQGNIHLVHTLNGSGLAVGRTMVAIIENFQNEDGTITLPEVLHSYMGTKIL